MNSQSLIMSAINAKKSSLLKGIKRAKDARDNAPTPTESHSDTSRNQNEQLVFALEADLKKLDEMASEISRKKDWPYIEIAIDGSIKKIILVNDGLGGSEIDGIVLLSESSPLGTLIKDKKAGHKFVFNEQNAEVLVA